jgi:hypothetical protein
MSRPASPPAEVSLEKIPAGQFFSRYFLNIVMHLNILFLAIIRRGHCILGKILIEKMTAPENRFMEVS